MSTLRARPTWIVALAALCGGTALYLAPRTDAADAAQRSSPTPVTKLTLISARSDWQDLLARELIDEQPSGFERDAEREIATSCRVELPPAPDEAGPLTALAISLFVEPIAEIVLGGVEAELAERLREHSAVYTGSAGTTRFYTSTAPRGRALSWTCLRLSRLQRDDTGRLVLALDLIAEVRLTEHGDALQIRPRRLYVGSPAARTSDRRLSVAASVAATATWVDGNEGKSREAFETRLFARRLDLARAATVYFDDLGFDRYPLLPLPPWTVGTADEPAGNVVLRLTVAEAGTTPWLLEQGHALVGKIKGRAGGTLESALLEAIKPPG